MAFPAETVIEAGAALAERCGADSILLLGDEPRLYEALQARTRHRVILCVGDAQTYFACKGRVERVLYVAPSAGRWTRIRNALLRAVAAGHLRYVDNVVCIGPLSKTSADANAIVCLSVAGEIPGLGSSLPEIARRVRPEVFSEALSIGLELSTGGEDGGPVGTMFVLGDTATVQKYSRPLSLNPLKGYAAFERNIASPSCRESIKQFARLDGGFIVDREGTILAAGTFFDAETRLVENPPGLGTRHAAAAAITKLTRAIAVVVSASGGTVRVFMDGKIVEEMRPE